MTTTDLLSSEMSLMKARAPATARQETSLDSNQLPDVGDLFALPSGFHTYLGRTATGRHALAACDGLGVNRQHRPRLMTVDDICELLPQRLHRTCETLFLPVNDVD